MKPKAYKVLEMCVEEGIAYGYMRAHKHNDNPDERQIKDAMYSAVMNEICEWFDMGEKDD